MKTRAKIICAVFALLPLLVSAQDSELIRPNRTFFHLNFLNLGPGFETPIGKYSTLHFKADLTLEFDFDTDNDDDETYWRLGSLLDISYRRYYKGIFQKLKRNNSYKGHFFDYFGVVTRVIPPAFIDDFPNERELFFRFAAVAGASYYFENVPLYFDFFIGPATRLNKDGFSFGWPVVGATFGMLLNGKMGSEG
ncbi:MAG: hypothetical protein AAF990_11460 [Bacteroidota bacterium]